MVNEYVTREGNLRSPDIVASMMDLGEIGEFDVVLCSHALEHLHKEDVDTALNEFSPVVIMT